MNSVGWIGIGKMGEAMAERLIQAGYSLEVWNRTPEKCKALVDSGAKLVESPQLAATNEVVFSMVLDDKALAELYEREDGVLAGAAKVWVDCSSISPEAAAKAAQAAASAGVAFINAPVSGNPSVVRAGRLIFAVSGSENAIDVARPYLDSIGRAVHVVGSTNQASVVKICTNALLGVLMETLSEVTVLAEASGVKRSAILDFINDSAVGSPFSTYKTPALVALDTTPTFTNEASVKDLKLALSLGQANGISLPLVDVARTRYEKLVESGLGAGLDIIATLLQVAADSNFTLGQEESKNV
jgi:3-hydroxyisobutyrate dehydrogenase-like beta-hydroxyacid dehydrogenase